MPDGRYRPLGPNFTTQQNGPRKRMDIYLAHCEDDDSADHFIAAHPMETPGGSTDAPEVGARDIDRNKQIGELYGSFGHVVGTFDKPAFLTDEFGNLAYLNASAQMLTGMRFNELAGESINEFLFQPLVPLAREYNELLIEALDRDGLASRSMIPITMAGQNSGSFDFNVFPLMNDENGLYGGIVIVTDVYGR